MPTSTAITESLAATSADSGRTLRGLREARGLSREALAHDANRISSSTVRNAENGQTPRRVIQLAIAEALGVKVEDIWPSGGAA